MERSQVGFEPDGEDCFLDALVQLEQMRMTGADADPDYFRPAFSGERSEADERQEKRFPGNGSEFFRKRFLNFGPDISEKGESEMHLARFEPTDPAQMRIQFREGCGDRFRQLD